VSGLAASFDQRTPAELAGDVAQLYMRGERHADVGEALNLTRAQTHKILSELFAEGTPKLMRRRLSDEKVRAIHALYVRGDGSIDKITEAIGFTPSVARRRMRKPELPLEREMEARRLARSSAHAEQRVITALLMASVDELRKPRALSLERLAGVSNVSMWTLQHLSSEFTDPRLSIVLRLCRGLGVTAGAPLRAAASYRAGPNHACRRARAGADT
jgi:hypothetical protein